MVTDTVETIAKQGGTPLVVADSARVLGVIHLKDIVKGGIKERFVELRRMTRLEAGGLQIKKEPHPMEEVIGSALQRLERRLEPHRITTQLPQHLSMVPMDAILIEQVFINLLDNALAYGPPEGAIEISVAPSNGMVVSEIADLGPGVPQGDEQRVFEKFYRGSPKREGGLGLGLTICRGIVEAHADRP